MSSLKLGLKPLPFDSRDLMFRSFRTAAPLPKHPANFGHEGLIRSGSWDMLANNERGCCVWSGAAHETMLWNAMAGRKTHFTDEGVLSDYAAVTGFNPKTGANDNGTDMRAAAKYRMKTGIVDDSGIRHKIGAFVFIQPGDLESLLEAVWLFGAVGIGFQVTEGTMRQFETGKPWSRDLLPSRVVGGHYVPVVSDRTYPQVVTWAKLQSMTPNFYRQRCMTAIAYISEEMLTAGKSPEGFDLPTLIQYQKQVANIS